MTALRGLVRIGLCILILVLAGCADDQVSDPGPSGDDRETLLESRDRYMAACERVGGDQLAGGCGRVVDRAIEAALAAGCTAGSVDAYVEVGIARRFTSLPDDAFFERCPGPLASAALADPPDGYVEVQPPAAGVGLLDTDAAAATFVDPPAIALYLADIGHQVSYARRWQRSDDGSVTVRLDRFDTVEGAAHFTARDLDETDDESLVVAGVDDGRITRQEFDAEDGREQVRQLAFGRVCDVAVSLVVRTGDQPWGDQALEMLFVQQVHRVRAVTTC